MSLITHLDYMNLALQLAEMGRLTCSPNPMVGCLIVKNDQIIGAGYHERAGDAHAEIQALNSATAACDGATAYVTLEPCCHQGKTPPCTTALIAAGIKKVYVSCVDPNPLVQHKGIETLKNAGIEVEVGLCSDEASQLNKIFFHFMKHKRPFVIAKWAMSLDGQMKAHDHDRMISNDASQLHAHQLRQQVDAILIGANTARDDNPLLTTRLTEEKLIRHPIRIILSSHGDLPHELRMFDNNMPNKTIIVSSEQVSAALLTWIKKQNKVELLICKSDSLGQIDLNDLLFQLGKQQITSLLVEGGQTVLQNFFRDDLINQTHVYLAPVILGTLPSRKKLSNMVAHKMDDNYHITANFVENE